MAPAKLIYKQSAAIPVRQNAKGVWQVLMITTRHRRRWIFPKGMVEPYLNAATSAAKEALEEAGVTGYMENIPLGVFETTKWRGGCEVEVYALFVESQLDKWQEDFRKRRWVDLNFAIKEVDEPGFIPALEQLCQRLL
ncbi:NUDIX hydrolase [Magnetococcus marinus MC-1]|uniref:NUDIX hydrolase n=1 Tax=Magnetococcus marinus (strain ATCC BAA-1437 / JCM 17883 / MC-1) TaxID=156889 RepID=A0L8K1_MAGMM|nr:NUDIX hydrolase [Magnetococcus marinus]ABK44294.1 NUDIX hydrolase [Magnetococcus marinus MC-1]